MTKEGNARLVQGKSSPPLSEANHSHNITSVHNGLLLRYRRRLSHWLVWGPFEVIIEVNLSNEPVTDIRGNYSSVILLAQIQFNKRNCISHIYSIFEGAGLIINCLYFYAIIRFTKQSLGSYKILLLLFASYDFFLVLLHYFLKPVRLSRTWTRFLNSKWLFQRVMVVGTLIGVAADYWDSRVSTLG